MRDLSLIVLLLLFINYSFGQKYKDDGFTSEIHKKLKGKIVFANNKIQLSNEDENAFITEYKAGETLYMRAYFDESPANKQAKLIQKAKLGTIDLKYNFFINDKLVYSDLGGYTPKVSAFNASETLAKLKKGRELLKVLTTINSPLLVETKPQYTIETIILYALRNGAETTFKKGSFKLKLSIELYDKKQNKPLEVLSEGEITVIVNDVKDWLKNENVSKYISKDIELENKMKIVAQNHSITNNWDETYTKVVVAEPNWWTVKNSVTGQIVSRQIAAYAFLKYPDGSCSEREIVFAQSYLGNGKYSDEVYFSHFRDYFKKTSCNCYHK